tara:strand:- start:1917 stop:2456 length:540 start_codon:yes stop_codon:yes gene_type:complete
MKTLRWVIAIFLFGWLGQYLMAVMIPYLVMERLYIKAAERSGYNQLVVISRIDETSRWVVRPSPDLMYASCMYNLEEGPLAISAPVPERYWSMQFYQMNTDNFASITNQRKQQSRVGTRVEVTLVGPDASPSNYAGEVIQSPSVRGVMLMRASGIGNDSQMLSALNNSRCSPLDKVASS